MRALGMVLVALVVGVGGCAGEDAAPPEEPAPEEASTPSEDSPVEVPDVTGENLDAAKTDLEDGGFTVTVEPDPGDAIDCTVADQDVIGQAEPETDVTISIVCSPPDVTGEDADTAQADVEDQGFSATFDPDLGVAAPTTCTVEDQDPIEEAEPEGEVILTAVCEVPDVTGEDADTARADLEGAGFTATFDPEPSDPFECTVEDQDLIGEVDPGSDVILTVDCPGDSGY